MSDFKPLAALIFATEVPYRRAMLESVSPFFTVCRAELDLEDFATVFDFDDLLREAEDRLRERDSSP